MARVIPNKVSEAHGAVSYGVIFDRARANRRTMKDFNDCVPELGLVRLEHVGDGFTWFKHEGETRLGPQLGAH